MSLETSKSENSLDHQRNSITARSRNIIANEAALHPYLLRDRNNDTLYDLTINRAFFWEAAWISAMSVSPNGFYNLW